jgi:hypothetical protein
MNVRRCRWLVLRDDSDGGDDVHRDCGYVQ